MSEVSEFIWRLWLGDMPMPEGATREMMEAAIEAVERIDRQDEAVEGLEYHTKSLAHYEERLKEARSKGEDTKTLESIVKTTNEIIETYRSWLE